MAKKYYLLNFFISNNSGQFLRNLALSEEELSIRVSFPKASVANLKYVALGEKR